MPLLVRHLSLSTVDMGLVICGKGTADQEFISGQGLGRPYGEVVGKMIVLVRRCKKM